MTMLGRAPLHDGSMADPDRIAGRLGTRAALPRGRAVVGGLLVALAGIGLLLAHQAATHRQVTSWLIARHDIQAGARIGNADVAFAPMDLYSGTEHEAFRTPRGVVGATARTDIAAGELLQRGAIGSGHAVSGPARRLTLDLTPAQALDGSLVSGDRVDIVSSGDDPGTTSVIAHRVLVVSVRHPTAGLGSNDEVRLTLVVSDETVAKSVIDGALHGKITLLSGAGDGG
jgi:Flp pilus assembly protein CpaB